MKHQNKLRNLRIQDRIDGINSISFTICRIHHQSLPSTYVYDEQDPVVTNNIFMSECIKGLEITKYNLLYKCLKIIPTVVRQENQSILQFQTDMNTLVAYFIITSRFFVAVPAITASSLIVSSTHSCGSRNLCGCFKSADSFPNTLVLN